MRFSEAGGVSWYGLNGVDIAGSIVANGGVHKGPSPPSPSPTRGEGELSIAAAGEGEQGARCVQAYAWMARSVETGSIT